MARKRRPQARVVDGRRVVNRDWIAERTGAGASTVKHWYASRHDPRYQDAGCERPPAPFPETACTIGRVDFYDEEQFEAFYAAHRARKRMRVLPTDPELYEGSHEDLVSINDAARWFHFAGPGVIRKYLRANPGYFPAPVDTVTGPSGRDIPAFLRGDLQAFARRRDGDNTGVAGRRSAPPGSTD
ncbi:hypothetical protein ACWD01_33515 [Streptomyces sp. NPDC002835]